MSAKHEHIFLERETDQYYAPINVKPEGGGLGMGWGL